MADLCVILTDFGNKDNFTGVMKGVVSKINPETRFIDLCNEIPQGDIKKAHFQLASSFDYMPDAVYLVVVDPGVGSGRKAIIAKYQDSYFVAPDNGVLTRFIDDGADIYEIIHHCWTPAKISFTFHGRDIFATTAGALLNGVDIETLAKHYEGNAVKLEIAKPKRKKNIITGMIQYVDNFGNAFTNIRGSEIENEKISILKLNGIELTRLNTYYSEVKLDVPGALIGSSGFLEFFVNSGRADEYFNAKYGDVAEIELM